MNLPHLRLSGLLFEKNCYLSITSSMTDPTRDAIGVGGGGGGSWVGLRSGSLPVIRYCRVLWHSSTNFKVIELGVNDDFPLLKGQSEYSVGC